MPYTELPRSNDNSQRMADPLLSPRPEDDSARFVVDSDRSVRRRPPPTPGRILDRDADFFQSRGRWSGVELLPRERGRRNRNSLSQGLGVHNQNRRYNTRGACCGCGWIAVKRKLRQYLPLLWDDWFHTLAYQRTLVLMTILFVTYFAIVVLFGFVYLTISILGAQRTLHPDGSYVVTSYCNMQIDDHMEALYFSLSTMTTIGYGVSDYYFGGCWTPLLLVLCQVCTAITFDAVAVGLLFTRLSRGRKRSKSIVVSNQAVVQVVQGIPYFMFRVGELRRFPLMDASVRVFCLRHERIPRVYPMPPKNDLASVATARTANTTLDSRGTLGSRDHNHPTNTNTIPVETTHFVARAMKLLHPDESLMHSNHILMGLPQVIVHRLDSKSPLMPPSDWYDAHGHHHRFPLNPDNLLDTQLQIQDFWNDRGIEIVVLVEGIDELTGAMVQTRHSYCTTNHNNNATDAEDGDVAWNRAFVDCVLPASQSGNGISDEDDDEDLEGGDTVAPYHTNPHSVCTVDFARFHDTVPTPRDCLASPYVPY